MQKNKAKAGAENSAMRAICKGKQTQTQKTVQMQKKANAENDASDAVNDASGVENDASGAENDAKAA